MGRFTERGGWWVAGQVCLIGLVVAALFYADGDLGMEGGVRTAVQGLGLVTVASGVGLGLWGTAALGRNLTPYPEPAAGGELVVRGPYRLVRHPIYGAVVLLMVGVSLGDVNALAVACSLVLGGYFVAKARHEERRLLDAYPGYAEYQEHVSRRLIPWLI